MDLLALFIIAGLAVFVVMVASKTLAKLSEEYLYFQKKWQKKEKKYRKKILKQQKKLLKKKKKSKQ